MRFAMSCNDFSFEKFWWLNRFSQSRLNVQVFKSFQLIKYKHIFSILYDIIIAFHIYFQLGLCKQSHKIFLKSLFIEGRKSLLKTIEETSLFHESLLFYFRIQKNCIKRMAQPDALATKGVVFIYLHV